MTAKRIARSGVRLAVLALASLAIPGSAASPPGGPVSEVRPTSGPHLGPPPVEISTPLAVPAGVEATVSLTLVDPQAVGARFEIRDADDRTVESGTLTDLIPGQDRVVEYAWNWFDGNHTLEFTIDPAGQITETSEANNVVEDRTNGLAVGFWVEESVHAYFHEYQHELGIGSNSWEDWAQRQMAR